MGRQNRQRWIKSLLALIFSLSTTVAILAPARHAISAANQESADTYSSETPALQIVGFASTNLRAATDFDRFELALPAATRAVAISPLRSCRSQTSSAIAVQSCILTLDLLSSAAQLQL